MSAKLRPFVVAGSVAAIVFVANKSEGGYFSQSWGWIALAFVVPTTVVLILGRATPPGVARTAFVALMLLLTGWVVMSATWSDGVGPPFREGERMLAYVGLAFAIAFVLRRGDGPPVIGGLVVGVALVASYALAMRLFPDVFETYDDPGLPYRLSEPVGYWNALGLLTAMGFIMSFGVVAHARRLVVALAAAALMPTLAVTLYFTFSRGAWIAQVFGYAVMVALDSRRLRVLGVSAAVAVPSLLTAAYASTLNALTTEGALPARASAEGHRLAVVIAAATVASVACAWGSYRLVQRLRVSRRVVRAVNVTLVAGVLAAIAGVLIVAGGPVHGARALKARFDAPGPSQTNLNKRLLSFSGSGRSDQIRIAIDAGREEPVLGTGAGSYEARWYEDRRTQYVIRDAHSLYAEMFGELGFVGLSLVSLLVLVPVAGVVRARRSPAVPAAAGAYLAWVAHSSLDWNWEIVGVTMTAILAGGVGMLASERRRRAPVRRAVQFPVIALLVALTLASLVSLVGNQALFAARSSVIAEDWSAALGHARKARTLLPWSSEAYVVYGDAAAGFGDRPAAIAAYREALERSPRNWVVWLRVAQVGKGKLRVQAYKRVHELNPLETGLPAYVYRRPG